MERTMSLENWELLSHIVTVIGLPLAIFVFRASLPSLLRGEDSAFVSYLNSLLSDEGTDESA
jgi:hypothetical protein